jgi:hypothetical protein
MNKTIILDGSKLSWRNGTTDCDAMGLVIDFPDFPQGGRPPRQVTVFSHRTRSEVVFDFVELSEDPFSGVTLNYAGRLPDGRHCHLSLAAD